MRSSNRPSPVQTRTPLCQDRVQDGPASGERAPKAVELPSWVTTFTHPPSLVPRRGRVYAPSPFGEGAHVYAPWPFGQEVTCPWLSLQSAITTSHCSQCGVVEGDAAAHRSLLPALPTVGRAVKHGRHLRSRPAPPLPSCRDVAYTHM